MRASTVRVVALLVVALLAVSACTSDESVSTTDTSSRDRIITGLDTDEDGVVDRGELEFQQLIQDPDAVVGTLTEETSVLAHQVLTSLVESPPTLMPDPENPASDAFVARLTSMLRLRLAGVALTDLGFAVDLMGTDLEINASVEEALGMGFEEFAREKTLREEPGLFKFASPHCITMIATTTEDDVLAATQRVLAGETARDVAFDVNFEGATEPGGDIGCRLPTEWSDLLGATGGAISQLEVGEASAPQRFESLNSPTDELFIVVFLDEVKLNEFDVDSLGPFTNSVLQQQMTTYDVFVAPQLGMWSMDSLTVVIPTS